MTDEVTGDRKSLAVILGAALGVAVVATAVALYVNRHSEPAVKDINDVFDEARRTLSKLDKAVEALRSSVST